LFDRYIVSDDFFDTKQKERLMMNTHTLSVCILLLVTAITGLQAEPLTSRQWAAGAGMGGWYIFDWSGGERANRPRWDTAIPRLLKSYGITGGRMHLSDVFGVCCTPDTMHLDEKCMKVITNAVDEFMAQDMYIMFQMNFAFRHEVAQKNSDVEALNKLGLQKSPERQKLLDSLVNYVTRRVERHFSIWHQLCNAWKGKPDRLAMGPWIECHLFDGWWEYRYEMGITETYPWLNTSSVYTALENMQNIFVDIMRKYHPTRLVGYKARGAAKLGNRPLHKHPLNNHYHFPYGSNPKDKYQVAIIAYPYVKGPWYDWNVNKQYTNERILQLAFDEDKAWQFAKSWSESNDIGVFCDHWYFTSEKKDKEENPDIWINREASLAAGALLYEKLRSNGLAMAGPKGCFFETTLNGHYVEPYQSPFKVQVIDLIRRAHGIIGSAVDTDSDGLNKLMEVHPCINTDPNIWDTDGDGLRDGYDLNVAECNPRDPDTDNDGKNDGDEIRLYRTDPLDPTS